MTLYLRPSALTFIAGVLILLPSVVSAATLSLRPSASSFNAGDTFTETVVVDSADQALNAISGELIFPTELLQVLSLSKVRSVLSLWVQEPAFNNAVGVITWGGIIPNPGYQGPERTVITITFRAKAAGTADIAFSSSSVLANDGSGSNILVSAKPASITIGGARAPQVQDNDPALLATISSTVQPGTAGGLPRVTFSWTNATGVRAVRLGADHSPDGLPGVLYADPISTKQVELEPGTWYFHVQEEGARGWGAVSTYKIDVPADAGAPSALTFGGRSSSLFSYVWTGINYVSLLLIMIALVAVLGYAGRYALVRFTSYGASARGELQSTEAELVKEFDRFKSIIGKEIAALERAKLRRALTNDEERLLTHVRTYIDLTADTRSGFGLSREKRMEALERMEEALALSNKAIGS